MDDIMKCHNCGSVNSLIMDSRKHRKNKHGFYYRTRECQECGRRWKTQEVPMELTKDGTDESL